LDLSYISIVENEPFYGIESKSAMEHMNELSSLSNLFSGDTKLRMYFVAKIFPFSLKGAAKAWSTLSFKNIFLLVLNMLLCRKSLTLSR
jgi:hypothetical protein